MRPARLACALVLLLLGAAAPSRAASRAAGGVALLPALESAPASVVAELGAPVSLDQHAFRAPIRVETALHGPYEPGARLEIAWEERAASREPRFAAGERVLLCLVPLPGASIWLQRVPDPGQRAALRAVAMRGDAFLRSPGLGSVVLLQHYLALAPEQREGGAGIGYLVDLVAEAELPLARSAVERLGRLSRLPELLGEELGATLARAFLRADADAGFRSDLARLIGERSLSTTRPALESLIAAQPAPPPEALEALALLDGGIEGPRLAKLLENAPVEQRRVAARRASGPGAEESLADLLAADPAPEVRAAAAERLGELGGDAVVEPLLRGLGDPEASVRGVAARRLAWLGTPVVGRLRLVADGNDPEAAAAAVVALGLCGAPEARTALVEIAESHPDAGLRSLADIALGRPVGHRD